jgi:hypothetical protein
VVRSAYGRLETDLLAALDLYDAALVDHDLDGAVDEAANGLADGEQPGRLRR